ncbi:hypothetical protein [Deinococcus hopiensis]|uniref:Uncharacterized protein n=1 Tax=Deinococcus hopiensis KR-140 TaxID=695939 RepID=A0A1W1VQS2_9DEIO|nr:hypothetical protein [Deinococcus hopiensis]SMB95431.1 hypothetical protein SAMN00790413_02839 [Deinococcus hopiensis KR-140]
MPIQVRSPGSVKKKSTPGHLLELYFGEYSQAAQKPAETEPGLVGLSSQEQMVLC